MTIVVVKLPSECGGSADALRHLSILTHEEPEDDTIRTRTDGASSTSSAIPILPPTSHIMILPADLILYGHLNNKNDDALGSLADAHRMGCHTNHNSNIHHHPIMINNRHPHSNNNTHQPKQQSSPSAVTMLLTDVSEYDDNGLPLKESHKARKGGIARDDDEIEYIALSSAPPTTNNNTRPQHPSSTPTSSLSHYHHQCQPPVARILFKQSKYSVEEDVENTASTPKLTIPKALFHTNSTGGSSDGTTMTIRTEWSDVHVFVVSSWVVKLLHARPGVRDLAKELIPLLVKRQFRGVRSTFGRIKDSMSGKTLGVVMPAEQKEEEEKRRELLEGVLGDAPFFCSEWWWWWWGWWWEKDRLSLCRGGQSVVTGYVEINTAGVYYSNVFVRVSRDYTPCYRRK